MLKIIVVIYIFRTIDAKEDSRYNINRYQADRKVIPTGMQIRCQAPFQLKKDNYSDSKVSRRTGRDVARDLLKAAMAFSVRVCEMEKAIFILLIKRKEERC